MAKTTDPLYDFDAVADARRDAEDKMRSASVVYDHQVELMNRIYGSSGNGLGQTQRLVLAFAMAVHSGSESTIEWTTTRALNHGATEEMLHDAIDIALLNGGTFAVANARVAFAAIAYRLAHSRGTKSDFRVGDPARTLTR
jgi:alkylhydroperoxidase/carboxymuconolactone decarboxylase family protein YurZ